MGVEEHDIYPAEVKLLNAHQRHTVIQVMRLWGLIPAALVFDV